MRKCARGSAHVGVKDVGSGANAGLAWAVWRSGGATDGFGGVYGGRCGRIKRPAKLAWSAQKAQIGPSAGNLYENVYVSLLVANPQGAR